MLQIHCFDAATLEREYTTLTYPIVSGCLGFGGVGYGPLAVGPRWLAYSGTPVVVSDTGRVSPQHLTSPSLLTPSNGSLVAHYAKESSKQLAAGIVTLGDMGYKKLSRYCSERNISLRAGNANSKAYGVLNGYSLDDENAGMVCIGHAFIIINVMVDHITLFRTFCWVVSLYTLMKSLF